MRTLTTTDPLTQAGTAPVNATGYGNQETFNVPLKLCNLPPFPQVAAKVLGMSSDAEANLRTISNLIEADQAFAAEVLHMANSPLFGFTSQVHVIQHAVAILGLERVKSLSFTVAMRTYFETSGPSSSAMQQCWRHSIASAAIAEVLSRYTRASKERAYTAGLMHDVGRLGLLRSHQDQYAQVLDVPYLTNKFVLGAECSAVGITHCQAGGWLAGTWGLPQELRHIAAHHHEANTHDAPSRTVALACTIASFLGYEAVRVKQRPDEKTVTTQLPVSVLENEPKQFFSSLARTVEEKIRIFET